MVLRRVIRSCILPNQKIIQRRFCAPAYQGKELPKEPEGGAIPDFMNVTVCSPAKVIMEDVQATLVTVPGNAGAFGVSPGHIPVLCELQPGILSVYTDQATTAGKQQHYFVSGGFAVVHHNSTMEVSAVDVHPLDDFDTNALATNLAAAQSRVQNAKEEKDIAEATIELEALQALLTCLTFD